MSTAKVSAYVAALRRSFFSAVSRALLLLGQEQRDGDGGQQADDHHDDEKLDEGEAALTVALLLKRFLEHVTLQGLSVVGRLLPDHAPIGRCRGATFPPVIGKPPART